MVLNMSLVYQYCVRILLSVLYVMMVVFMMILPVSSVIQWDMRVCLLLCLLLFYFSYSDGTSIDIDQASYGTLPEGTQYFNNYTCPPDAEHYDNCSVNSTTNPQCTNSSYNYVIRCSRREHSECHNVFNLLFYFPFIVCDEGYFIYNPVNTSSPGYYSVTGIAASCADNYITGICNNIGYISNNIPRIFCNSSGFEGKVMTF